MTKSILPTQAEAMAAALREEVNIYIQQEKYYQALAKIEELLELNAFDNDLLFTKAKLHFLVEEYDKAYHWLKAFADNQGPDYRSYVLNGEIQFKLGHKEETLKILYNFFQGLAANYFIMPDEVAYDSLDALINKLKKSYKWNKLIRLCPPLKDYESQRRKALKQMQINGGKAEGNNAVSVNKEAAALGNADITTENTNNMKNEHEAVITTNSDSNTEELITDEAANEVEETTAVDEMVANTEAAPKALEQAPHHDLVAAGQRDLVKQEKDLATTPAKEVATTPTKEVKAVPAKNVVNPMEKLLAQQQEKQPEVEDEYGKMTYEEIFALVQELWDKGRLSTKQQRQVLHQDVAVVTKAVEQQILSLRKKIWLFTYLANVFRQRLLFDEAIFLLRAGLQYDDEDVVLLKNLGYTLMANGEDDVAEKVLQDAQLGDLRHQNMDFAIIDLLNQCSK